MNDVEKKIHDCEERIGQLSSRIALVNTEAFQTYQKIAVRPLVEGIEAQLLRVRNEGPLTDYEMGVLQGQRQALLGLTFDEAQCQNAISELRQRITNLREEQKALAQRVSHHEGIQRREGRPLYQEVETTQPQGEWK